MATASHHLPHDRARKGAGAAFFPYNTPHGPLTIGCDGNAITAVALGETRLNGERKPNALTNDAATQILEYLAGKRRAFDLELAPAGSPFQWEVWRAVEGIPYGTSLTCAELARKLGRPGSHRSVGAAVRSNPLAILIPAHRVVGANGKPLGTGRQAAVKQALLRMEREAAPQAQ